MDDAEPTRRLTLDLTDNEILALGFAIAAGHEYARMRDEKRVAATLFALAAKVEAGWSGPLPTVADAPPAAAADEKAARAAGEQIGLDLDHFKAVGKDIGNVLKTAIGSARVGFGLFLFSFGEGGWMTWLSNAERADMTRALKEWIAKNEAPPPKARG